MRLVSVGFQMILRGGEDVISSFFILLVIVVSCRYLYNPTKANSLPEGIYNASRPRVNTCLMDVANEKLFKSYSFTSGIEVSRDKFLEYINSETRNHVEINGTVSAE